MNETCAEKECNEQLTGCPDGYCEKHCAVHCAARCELCGEECKPWQRFCGAACCAKWEAGERGYLLAHLKGG